MGARCFKPHPTLGNLGFSASIEDRFWDKCFPVVYDRGCWLWIGCKQKLGYGHIGRGMSGSGLAKAHVVSWLLHHGPFEKGLWVLHKCDNPNCVNPSHLYLGNAKDNNRDAAVRGRNSRKLSESAVRMIRSEWPKCNQVELASRYGVSTGAIFHIVHNNTWKHLL